MISRSTTSAEATLVNVSAPSVYLVRADGDSRTGVGLYNGDVLVVDKAAVANQAEVALGVKMGQPHFQLRDLVERRGLIACSSNYALYYVQGDLKPWAG